MTYQTLSSDDYHRTMLSQWTVSGDDLVFYLLSTLLHVVRLSLGVGSLHSNCMVACQQLADTALRRTVSSRLADGSTCDRFAIYDDAELVRPLWTYRILERGLHAPVFPRMCNKYVLKAILNVRVPGLKHVASDASIYETISSIRRYHPQMWEPSPRIVPSTAGPTAGRRLARRKSWGHFVLNCSCGTFSSEHKNTVAGAPPPSAWHVRGLNPIRKP